MQGVILAAGRGSRMQNLTDDRPKSLVELGGRPLLQWQISAMRFAGIETIFLVTGYLAEKMTNQGVKTLFNPEWSTSNMVVTLLTALPRVEGEILVSYSDIVYEGRVAAALAQTPGDLVIAYDPAWLQLWSRRFHDPLADAESFRIDPQGRILDIGRKVDNLAEIQGQYMGLLKISPLGQEWIRAFVADNPSRRNTLDMTSLLQGLISQGKPVTGYAIRGTWCEVDQAGDLEVAEQLLKEGRLTCCQG